jgi:hypothetical protein
MKVFAYSFMAMLAAAGMASCKDDASATSAAAGTSVTPAAQPATSSPSRLPEELERAQSMEQTSVEWVSEEFNYGTVPAGTVVTHRFRFKNTGSAPLTLTNVKASCGCTTPEWSKDPVAPGAEGFVEAKFNSTGRSGANNKTITVTGNFPENRKVLKLTGMVQGEAGTPQ